MSWNNEVINEEWTWTMSINKRNGIRRQLEVHNG